ncbi:MAG: hypothetical protein IPL95_11165 [Saprospiraceae bacterium]|nr:hypothetical protein [Saprospiraceae bacterium]
MRWTIIYIALLGLTACNNQTINKQIVTASNDSINSIKTIQYSENELFRYLIVLAI